MVCILNICVICGKLQFFAGDVAPQIQQNGTRLSPSKTAVLNISADTRAVTLDAFNEIVRERNSLRDELRELENSYSDLFKRYEKMRENCVLLKNVSFTRKVYRFFNF